MKATLATTATDAPASRAAAPATAPRLTSVIGNRAMRAALTGTNAATRAPLPPALCVQLEPSLGRAPRGPRSHPARANGGRHGAAAIQAAAARGIAAPALDDSEVRHHAARGVRGPGEALPHRATIETLLGRDLSHVRAHVGGAAAASARAIGAEAYATGNSVAFARPPSLHTAAHEAAHVVQQAAGVQLLGGVGHAGDEYERNADAVADRVVAGAPAADLLPGGRDAAAGGTAAVQPKGPAEPVQAQPVQAQPVQREETPAPNPYVSAEGKPNLAAVQSPMSHPEWPPFRNVMARYGVSEEVAGQQWQKLCRGLELQATGGNGEPLFREVTDWMVETSGIDKFKKPALWAGWPTGTLAKKCGFNPLAEAALGEALAPLQLFDGDFQTTMRPLWVAISRAFADQLHGDVHIFMAKFAAESIVLTDEVPIIRQRQADGWVGELIFYAVDPASMPGGDVSHPIFLDAAGQPAEYLHPLKSELEVESALKARAAANAAGAK